MKSTSFINYLFIALFSVLSISFYFSIVLVNTSFYTLVLASIILFICTAKEERMAITRQVFSSYSFKAVLLWIILLYASALYAPSGPDVIYYAQKYKKFIFLFFLIYAVIYFTKRQIQLPQYFMKGLIWGAIILFPLSILAKTIGIEKGYFSNDYWVPSGVFIASLLFSIIAIIGILALYKKQWFYGFALLLIGLFEIFYVMYQKTAYLSLFVAVIWLVAVLPITKWRYKIAGLFIAITVTITVMGTHNTMSDRMSAMFSEIEKCYSTVMHHPNNADELEKHCDSSSGLRLFYYAQSIKQIKKSWLYGHGLGGLNMIADNKNELKDLNRFNINNPHNEYLLQGGQLGIIGVILLLSIFIIALRESLRIQSVQQRYLLSSIILLYAISCLFNSFLRDSMEGTLFVIMLTIISTEWIQSNLSSHNKHAEHTNT